MFRSSVVEHLTFNEGCVGSNPTGTTVWESSSVVERVPVKHNVECSIHSSPARKGQVAPMVEQWFEAPRVMVRFHCCPQNGEASVMATYGIVNAETRVQFSSSPKSVRQRWRAGMVCKTIALLNRFESYCAH